MLCSEWNGSRKNAILFCHNLSENIIYRYLITVYECDSAVVWFLYRYWLRFHVKNSWRSFNWFDNAVLSNTVGTRKSIGRTASKSESADGSVWWRAGCQWTAAGREGTLSNTRRICVRRRCNYTSWPQSVFVLQFLPNTLVVQVEQWSVVCVHVYVNVVTWNEVPFDL